MVGYSAKRSILAARAPTAFAEVATGVGGSKKAQTFVEDRRLCSQKTVQTQMGISVAAGQQGM